MGVASATGRPLDGVLVADLSRVLAGPLATMMLADLGADVVKVERPGIGDDTRSWGPPWTTTTSAYFESVNRNKRSVAFDLAAADDGRAVRELCRRADVVVENYRSGSLRRFGLSYEQVRESNPRVVYCSISGFGTTGPGASLPGYDIVAQAVGGLTGVTGHPGDPVKVGVALVDVLTGKDAVVGILAALRQRDVTGEGQHVEVNLLSSLLAALVNQAGNYLATGVDPVPTGNRHPSIAPYETLRCADALLVVAIGNDTQFAALSLVLGYAQLAADERFATNAARVAHRDELAAELEKRLGKAPAREWESRLHAVGIACGRVNTIGEAFEYADSLGLQPLVDVGPAHIAQVRTPIGLAGMPPAPAYPPPTLGEHTEQLRRWLAGPDGDPLPARQTAAESENAEGPIR